MGAALMDELLGKTVGGYEIQRLLGQGGMARVYLARQQSMNRQVALKVLPKQFLVDDTYLQRFEREVRIVSQLEHRNIIPVYDYGESDGQPYIVMRYMPAGTVDDLLKQGPMSPETALNIIEQIAPALDYAHSKEVLHRDLKPSNVLMDDNGGAFLTDFGIARITDGQGAAITTQGVVGTPSYMSPEQAQGKPIDGRSDVYSLGVMLFEMLTGRRPFEAETPYSIAVMQVTTPPPSPRSINPNLSMALERVLLKVLEKLPEDRQQTARDLTEGLRHAIERPHISEPEPMKAPVINQTPPVVVYQPPQAPVYTPQPRPMQQPHPVTPQPRPAYPNQPSSGQMPAYQTGQRPNQVRRRRPANPWTSALLGGTVGCGMLVLLLVVAVLVAATYISRQQATPFPADNRGVTQDASSSSTTPTLRVTRPSVLSGSPAPLDGTSDALRQTLVPDQTDSTTSFPTDLNYGLSEPPAVPQTTPSLMTALNDVTGTLLYADWRAGTGGVESFKVLILNTATWEEITLTDATTDTSYPTASPDGQHIVYQSNADGDFDIYIIKRDGSQLRKLTQNNFVDRLASWSPDSQWIIFSSDVRQDNNLDIYRVRPDGSELQLVFSDSTRKSHPRYSPDGRYIVFTRGSESDASSWEIMRYDLSDGTLTQLTDNHVRDASPLFSPDGRTILFITQLDGGDNAIATLDAETKQIRILYNSPGSDWAASYSPDGRFIAFSSNMNGGDQVFLMTADGQNVQQITINGGAYPSWLPGA